MSHLAKLRVLCVPKKICHSCSRGMSPLANYVYVPKKKYMPFLFPGMSHLASVVFAKENMPFLFPGDEHTW
jgi:hypothetical protein